MKNQIKHKESESRGIFYIHDEEDKKIAELTYSLENDVMTIDHTEVDPSKEGKGLGTKIVQYSVEFARENNRKINPLCPFAEVLFDKHEDWNDLRV